MRKHFASVAACAALLLGIASAGSAQAQAPTTSHYDISVWNTLSFDYPSSGSMDLTFHPDGAVTGYFHPEDLPSFIPIQGNRTGNKIWLAIGNRGTIQLNGQVDGSSGEITGSAYSYSSALSSAQPGFTTSATTFWNPTSLSAASGLYSFIATPKSSTYGP